MGTRFVYGYCAVDGDAPLELVRCDAYRHPVPGAERVVEVGDDGRWSAELDAEEDGAIYLATNNLPPREFWVYEPEDPSAAQEVDLRREVYPRNRLDTFLSADDRTLGINVETLMERDLCGEALFCEEQERMLCRYDAAMNGEDDSEMCRVDSALIERYENGD